MNLLKSIKNKKGMSGAVKGAMIFLTLAFAVASASYIIPVLAIHETTAVITPVWLLPNTFYTFQINVSNALGSGDYISEVRLYNSSANPPTDPSLSIYNNFTCFVDNDTSSVFNTWDLNHGNSFGVIYCYYADEQPYPNGTMGPGQQKTFYMSATTDNIEQCLHWTVEPRSIAGQWTTVSAAYTCVDKTPPNTTKTYGAPTYVNGSYRWINSNTPITLTAVDGGPTYPPTGQVGVGVDKIMYRITKLSIPDSQCTETCSGTGVVGSGNFIKWNGTPITIPNDSCHLIEFYANDSLGNTETVHKQCVFVDNQPPISSKSFIGPTYTDTGGQVWITQSTQINLTCQDQTPHPSDNVKIYYRLKIDNGGWSSWQLYSPLMSYSEDSVHNLQWYCVDALNNTEVTHNETDRVDSASPVITKSLIGPQIGTCPPKNPGDTCYIKDTTGGNGTIIQVSATDPDPTGKGCNVDQIKCQWGYYLDGVWKGMNGVDLTSPFNITFNDDSNHTLTIKCWDALGNKAWDNETFLVDSMPPVTNKTYGTPTMVNGNYRWINSLTPITLTATDNKVGVNNIQYRVTKLNISDASCVEACSDAGVSGAWTGVTGSQTTFTIPADSCHFIEYYAVDKLGNAEQRHYQCVFVDNHAPNATKVVGDPKVPCVAPTGGDSTSLSIEGLASQRTGTKYVAPSVAAISINGLFNPCDSAISVNATDNSTTTDQCAYLSTSSLPNFAKDAIIDQGGNLSAPGCNNVLILSTGNPTDNTTEFSTEMGNQGCGNNPDGYNTNDCVLLNYTPSVNSTVLAMSAEWPVYYQSTFTDWMQIGGVLDMSINSWPGLASLVNMSGYGPDEISGSVALTNIPASQTEQLRVADSGDSIFDTALIVVPKACFNQAPVAQCGNGKIDANEQCDPGSVGIPANDSLCPGNCNPTTCQCNLTCSDGTTYGQCSSVNKPSWCNSTGTLIPNQCNSPNNCPCPSGQSCNATTGSCYASTQNCSDGTLYGLCSVTKPKYCSSGTLINGCGSPYNCGCPSGQTCNATTNACYTPSTCSDGTLYGQCSLTKPSYCSSGTLINNCSQCGCSNGTCQNDGSCYTPPAGGCWYVKDHVTPVTLSCDDSWSGTVPHPVDNASVCYRISFDKAASGYVTGQYCSMFGGQMNGDWCCANIKNGQYVFNFTEDSNHNLEFYCQDALGNKGTTTDLESFKVDSTPPIINVAVGNPQIQVGNDSYIRDHVTQITVNPQDNNSLGCAVGGVTCSWMYNVDGGSWSSWNSTFPIIFNEDSTHYLDVKCTDALGNVAWDNRTFKVDSTPPVTTKTYSQPFYSPNGNVTEWISNVTNITMSASDPSISGCRVGGTQIWYRVTTVDDVYCSNQTICQSATGSGTWIDTPVSTPDVTKTFNIPDQSCHLIEFFSNDSLGNAETTHKQCAFVDTTGPIVNKTIGDPKEQWAGDNTFYPGLTQRCWNTTGGIECWRVTMLTKMSINCTDQQPHPVDNSKMCFQVELDGDDNTKAYCKDYSGSFNKTGDGYCCLSRDSISNFEFLEESQHDLKVKCTDALGNAGPVDEEKFKVEGCPEKICLSKKWNLISVPFVLFNDSPSEVFKNISDKIISVWSYDSGQWYSWAPGVGGTLTSIKPGYGYWVLANDDGCFEIAGSLFSPQQVPPSRDLDKGWNLIGYYGNTGMNTDGMYAPDNTDTTNKGQCKIADKPVYCALNSLIDTQEGFPRWSSLWDYFNNGNDKSGWTGLDACVGGKWTSSMEPFKGYWIEMDVSDGYAPATNCIWNTKLQCVS